MVEQVKQVISQLSQVLVDDKNFPVMHEVQLLVPAPLQLRQEVSQTSQVVGLPFTWYVLSGQVV